VHSRAARLYRYSHGALDSFDTIQAPAFESLLRQRGVRAERGGRGYPAPRGALKTELAHERQLAQSHRVATALATRLTLLAGPDSCVVVSGPPPQTRFVVDSLPRQLQGRTVVSSELDRTATHDAIVRSAKHAAREWRSRRGRLLVSHVFNHSGRRSVAGLPALQRALYLKAVDLLLISPRFLHLECARAERLLLAAVGQSAAVEILSGDAGTPLDSVGDGVGARLRFSIDEPVVTSATLDRSATPAAPRAS